VIVNNYFILFGSLKLVDTDVDAAILLILKILPM